MNRIRSTDAPLDEQVFEKHLAAEALPGKPHVDFGRYRQAEGETPLSMFSPLHYESGYAYPLVVWFHGSGSDERQLKRLMPHLSLRNYAAVATRGTVALESGGKSAGYAWSQADGDYGEAERRVMNAVLAAREKLNINPGRIFAAGFRDGGTMAYRLALSHPEHFAGVAALSGEFPRGCRTLMRLSEARRVPVFVACGQHGEAYPAERTCEDLKLLHTAGLDVTLRQYPGGDEISPAILRDIDRWIMQQMGCV